MPAPNMAPALDPLPEGWSPTVLNGAAAIEKRWRLANFAQAMALATAVAELAEALNHHPELHVAWGHLRVVWTTHDAGGVTALDVQAAHATDALAADLLPRTS